MPSRPGWFLFRLSLLVALPVGFQLVEYPGMSHVQQLGGRKQIIEAQRVGFTPAVIDRKRSRAEGENCILPALRLFEDAPTDSVSDGSKPRRAGGEEFRNAICRRRRASSSKTTRKRREGIAQLISASPADNLTARRTPAVLRPRTRQTRSCSTHKGHGLMTQRPSSVEGVTLPIVTILVLLRLDAPSRLFSWGPTPPVARASPGRQRLGSR